MDLVKAGEARTQTSSFREWMALHGINEDDCFLIEIRDSGKMLVHNYKRSANGKIQARLNAKFERIPETTTQTIDIKSPPPWKIRSNGGRH